MEKEEATQKKQGYPWQVLPGSVLKWIAVITMVVDHTAMVLVSSEQYPQAYVLMRSIGRLAFPIYCFLLVEGFYHTSSYFRYALSLFFFAILSEIPYNLARGGLVFYPQKQNVFFTLFLGLFMMRLIEIKREDAAWRLMFLMAFCGIAQLLRCDYGMYGIMQIAVLYFCRNVRLIGDVLVALLNFFQGGLQCYGALAIIPVECYNGKRGRQLKYFFYAVYPLHLLLLYFLRQNL